MRTFEVCVMGALEETRETFMEHWSDPEHYQDAMNFALGLFVGIVLKKMRETEDKPE
jgi:hypothetical protein